MRKSAIVMEVYAWLMLALVVLTVIVWAMVGASVMFGTGLQAIFWVALSLMFIGGYMMYSYRFDLFNFGAVLSETSKGARIIFYTLGAISLIVIVLFYIARIFSNN